MPNSNPKSINARSFDDTGRDSTGNAQRNAKATTDAFAATDGSDAATEQSDRAKAAVRRGTK